MPYRQARRTQRITCTERAAQACGGGSRSASIARHRRMLYAVPFRVGVVFTVASRTGCRPCFHPGWSRVFGEPLHNITCVSEGTLGQDNRSTAGQACSTLARHSTTCPAQHHLPGTAPLARHSTTCPAQHHLPGTAGQAWQHNLPGTAHVKALHPDLRLSALCVVPREGYLAYQCSSVPDTPSSAVGIPRSIHAISGIREHR